LDLKPFSFTATKSKTQRNSSQTHKLFFSEYEKKDLKNQEKGEQACITSNHLQKENKQKSEKV